MALSGSQMAYLDARAGIARAGASRANYFETINWHLVINGTERTTFLIDSIVINKVINQQSDTASVVVFGFTPTSGQTIELSIGSTDNRVFSGRIVRRERIVGSRSIDRLYYTLHCVDHRWELDKQLVMQEFPSQDAGVTAKAILATYTSGFTTQHVKHGLATLDTMSFEMESVSNALTRLANAAGAYWYIDDDKDLHFFITESVPQPQDVTTSSTFEWRNLKDHHDLSQIRNRVYSEGQAVGSSQLITFRLAATRGTVDATAGITSQGVVGNDAFLYTRGFVSGAGASDRYRVGRALYVPNLTLTEKRITASGAASIGASTLSIDSAAELPNGTDPGVVLVDNQIIHYSGVDTTVPALTGIPAAGLAGSIVRDIPDNSDVVRPVTLVITGPYVAYSHAAGEPVTTVRIRDNAGGQSTLASLMGGGDDGVRESYVVESQRSYAEAAARGDAEHVMWAAPRTGIEYLTRDVNANVGTQVDVNVAGLTGTYRIQQVTIRGVSQEGTRVFPWRMVRAGDQRFDFFDLLARVQTGRLSS